jgi:hypothetical protein
MPWFLFSLVVVGVPVVGIAVLIAALNCLEAWLDQRQSRQPRALDSVVHDDGKGAKYQVAERVCE